MNIQEYVKEMSRVFESNNDYDELPGKGKSEFPSVQQFCFEDWILFSIDRAALVGKYAVKKLDQISGSDVKRIAAHDQAIVLAGQRDYKNHSYKIYFDAAFGGINRHILTIDDEWAQVECNFSSLMAFADYVAERHDADVEKLKGEDLLQVSWFKDACLKCNCQ